MRVNEAIAALLTLAWVTPALAQDDPWFRTGEQVLVDLPETAQFMSATPEDIYFSEDYAIEVDNGGVVVTALRFFTAREGTPMSDASLLDAAQVIRTWLAAPCPAMELLDRAPDPVGGRPAIRMDLHCPSTSTNRDQAGESVLLTVISGAERLHAVMLLSGPDTSPEMFDDHAARMASAQFCSVRELGGPCLVD